MILGHRHPLSLRSCESWLSSCHLTFLQMLLWIGRCSANGLAGPCGPCAAQHCLAHLRGPAAVFQFTELPATSFFSFSVTFEHYWKFSHWRWLIGGLFSNLAVQPAANCPKPLVGIELWRQRTNERRRLTWAARWFFFCPAQVITSPPVQSVIRNHPYTHAYRQTHTFTHRLNTLGKTNIHIH